jgi:dipeptidyl aminopeptidase/acylaminoacyl peptidase
MRVLAEDAEADCIDLLLEPISLQPVAAYSAYLRGRWHVIDPAYADDFALLAAASTGDLAGIRMSVDKRNWLVYFEHDASSGQYFHYDRAAKQARFLFASQPALDKAALAPMEPVIVKTRDGLDLTGYLSRPRDAAIGKPLPMVLLVHGGPWSREAGACIRHISGSPIEAMPCSASIFVARRGSARLSSMPPTWSGAVRCMTI